MTIIMNNDDLDIKNTSEDDNDFLNRVSDINEKTIKSLNGNGNVNTSFKYFSAVINSTNKKECDNILSRSNDAINDLTINGVTKMSDIDIEKMTNNNVKNEKNMADKVFENVKKAAQEINEGYQKIEEPKSSNWKPVLVNTAYVVVGVIAIAATAFGVSKLINK